MATKNCETCEFFSKSTLECRRYPPRVVNVKEAQKDTVSYAKMIRSRECIIVWPAILDYDNTWCGEYKPTTEAEYETEMEYVR